MGRSKKWPAEQKSDPTIRAKIGLEQKMIIRTKIGPNKWDGSKKCSIEQESQQQPSEQKAGLEKYQLIKNRSKPSEQKNVGAKRVRHIKNQDKQTGWSK